MVAVADANGAKIAINSYDDYGIPGISDLGRFFFCACEIPARLHPANALSLVHQKEFHSLG